MSSDTDRKPSLLGRLRSRVGVRGLFALAFVGLLAGLISAYISARPVVALPPAFAPAANPYANGIYVNGIVESLQAHGANISIFPEVPGPVTRVFVSEGDHVRAGDPLIAIDDSVQRQTTEQQKAQMEAAAAQVASARASVKTLADTYAKQKQSQAIDPQSVSRDILDTAQNTLNTARANLLVAQSQHGALVRSVAASEALLRKYTIHAPQDGIVMSLDTMTGSYVSSQGAYNPYTQGYGPIIVMGSSSSDLEVRCYVDEILINRLPPTGKMVATMYVRGTNVAIPLTYGRLQPYVSPKIQLSDQRLEQVDVRVLPIVFRLARPANLALYPGQLVDVYIGSK
ncbi:MAG TPA: biotin/lipoyl-binding protein [Rhizomicrobium sp.]|nr:biotin/lipoyl-binding protein [Rhizomicrobium sp.]